MKIGKILWRGTLERSGAYAYSASPNVADGKLDVMREDGPTMMLDPGDRFEVLAVDGRDGFEKAGPVFLVGRRLIGTAQRIG